MYKMAKEMFKGLAVYEMATSVQICGVNDVYIFKCTEGYSRAYYYVVCKHDTDIITYKSNLQRNYTKVLADVKKYL